MGTRHCDWGRTILRHQYPAATMYPLARWSGYVSINDRFSFTSVEEIVRRAVLLLVAHKFHDYRHHKRLYTFAYHLYLG